ncbi:DNA mismatch repair protein MutS [Lichenifustis flavocetrariae]|uniref:DNA mismatch repair protein MutS n=1 Tax=Lichenifustis flavocetrariae TaxID=2949735 RepID=A0AA41Z066_9HYPH|nr:DNA mismatch repair protein MutS [Lichenifustis flavocetrariae]MCW6510348.1 DNA mismatch repair protein MutS [Lichenifustis flavocetrariae]
MSNSAARPVDLRETPQPSVGTIDDARVTPMMQQYLGIKVQYPDCLLFYRMGDFYELFLDDAEIAAKALNIVLTKRGKHQGEDIAMCGVPVDRSDDYLHRLIALGHRVAVCEQIEDPAEARKRGGKSVVKRAVVRLVTPGTLTEDRLLEPSRANHLVALSRLAESDVFGVAAVDISTGSFTVAETPSGSLPALLARLAPSEIVLADALHADGVVADMVAESKAAVTPVAREFAEAGLAERRLRDWYGVETLDGFGRFSRVEIAAAATAVAYVTRTQVGARPQLQAPSRIEQSGAMEIDPATRANLELTRTLGGERAGSLIDAIDQTVTSAGGRLLAERLAAPLTDPAAIAERLDAVTWTLVDGATRTRLRALLKAAPDMARALSRLALDRGGPRDLAALRDGLSAARAVAGLLNSASNLPAELLAAAAAAQAVGQELVEGLAAALADDLPLQKRDGGFVRRGYDPRLEETRALRDETRSVIAALQGRYAEETGIRTLKVKHNSVLGFFIEVSQATGESWLKPPQNALFIHRQTMAGAMRFATVELSELDQRIAAAAGQAVALELAVFDRLAAAVLASAPAIRAAADGLAAIDVACSLGEIAASRSWVRPSVDTSLAFAIQGGRHPVVEAALRTRGKGFVANDCDLSGTPPRGQAKGGGRIAVVTGPNMAGKSTFLRQNAVIALLAQTGSFVPATSAHIGIVDRLFSRVGAADDLARGRSTFMVEMVETAAILNQAGPRALVILDEIGRGTATFDGLSIAWAAVEHLHEVNRSRGLFATHYHELTGLAKSLKRLQNLTMRVTEWQGDVVFLHEVLPGAADRSYGIQVAKLAGLPRAAIERARSVLAQLEATSRAAPVARLVNDLPLFAVTAPPAPVAGFAEPRADPLRDALDAINPDELTPKAALDALYALKRVRAGAV